MGVEGSEDTFSHPANCFSCPEILYSRNCESADAPTSVGQESQFKLPIFVRSHHATDFSLPLSLGAKSREVKLPQVCPLKHLSLDHIHTFPTRFSSICT